MSTPPKVPFQIKTLPGPTADERAAKQREADRMLTKARRKYRLSAEERRTTRRYLRRIAARGNRPWYAIRTGFRAHLAVTPLGQATYCFHRCAQTTTTEPTAPLGMCRTCLHRWNRAVTDAKAMHVPRTVDWADNDGEDRQVTACQGCYASDETLPDHMTKAVKDGFDTTLLPLWPCAHVDETDPLAGPDDPQTWRALVEHDEARRAEKTALKSAARKPITDDEY